MPRKYEEQVASGITAITQQQGNTEWIKKIDRSRFDVSNYAKCPLFYVYGDYITGAKILDIWNKDEIIDPAPFMTRVAHGFTHSENDMDKENELTKEWDRQLFPECQR